MSFFSEAVDCAKRKERGNQSVTVYRSRIDDPNTHQLLLHIESEVVDEVLGFEYLPTLLRKNKSSKNHIESRKNSQYNSCIECPLL